ncbi:DNA internalization-related competence protein ComEC/Rec2 [Caballeronia udeis]|uniref:DNA internalization-related competence protein ComEC/Rec2 n=1 Tax=Caballeronia udeis TaxID=1232866 RepID=A0A158J965_9BURK|nr:DNA internalization-related competence protein ComEC/Rec2 [Caballeronia udeis]SAL64921.1 DNA internalization-related competence protein ComEC/Rec2 [Caballeronia udeis]
MRGILIGFALGVACLQQQAALPGVAVICALVLMFGSACAIAFYLPRFRAASLIAAALVVGFGYAAWRADTRLQRVLPVAFENRNIELTGFVRGLPMQGADSTRFLFEVESNDAALPDFPRVVQLSWIAVDGSKRGPAAVPPPALWAGQRWTLVARLKRPHGNANFRGRDAEVALLARNIRATGYVSMPGAARRLPTDARGFALTIDRWRARLRERVLTALDGAAHRGIVVALATGAQDTVSDADWTLLRATGTSHLVAISGLHIGFVAGLAALLSGGLWRRLRWRGLPAPLIVSAQKAAAAGAAIFAAFYAALAGFNVPAQRSMWMLCFVALAVLSGRRPASSLVLAWALALVLLADPWAVTAAGFWLSFCAVAAILFAIASRGRRASVGFAEEFAVPQDDGGPSSKESGDEGGAQPRRHIRDRLGDVIGRIRVRSFAWLRHTFRRIGRGIASSARVQYAITIGLAPLTAYWFFQIPLLGPLANAFAIPWISFLVTPTVLVAVLLPVPLDVFAYRAAHSLLVPMFDALAHLSGPAWTLWRLPQPDGFALVAAAFGVIWALAPRGWPLRFAAPLTWLPLALPVSNAPPAGTFRVTALDIGQGSSIVIETTHHTLLFDTGPGPESTRAGERLVVPYLFAHGLFTLDTLMISHSDSDHSGGAPAVLESIRVRQFAASLRPREALWKTAQDHGSALLRCVAGQRWQWDGVVFDVLWPQAGPLAAKPNATSCVLKVTSAAGRSALLTADIEADVERQLLQLGQREPARLQADVLIVPHHGSKTSSTEPFLDAVKPRVAVFQVGYRNRFNHPHPTVFERYRLRHIELSRSDEDGAARMDVSAEVSIERFRQTHARYWMGR